MFCTIALHLPSLLFHATPLATYRAQHVPVPGDRVTLASQRYRVLAREQRMDANACDESAGGWNEAWHLLVERIEQEPLTSCAEERVA
ncbi:MAG TPA: hypothetical protein VFV38_17125 [Ktedonobacteraceae bacterium]|nr:hypothetical protein [Ktedonobacteraceae bacterium]